MIPRIPDNCERFRQDGIGRWEFQFPGCENNAEWDLVDAIHDIAMRSANPESRLLWRDLCNAARYAWLDEAEKVLEEESAKILTGKPELLWAYWHHSVKFRSACYDILENIRPWEIDYAHCLAHAEAWAREASGE